MMIDDPEYPMLTFTGTLPPAPKATAKDDAPRMRQSDETDLIYPALVKLYGRLEAIERNAEGVSDSTLEVHRYANLAAIIEATRPHLKVCGLGVIRIPARGCRDGEQWAGAAVRIIHTSTQWVEFDPVEIPLGERPAAHVIGGALTYASRNAVSLALNIAQVDDDGNTANGVTLRIPPDAPVPPRRPSVVEAAERLGAERVAEIVHEVAARTEPEVREHLEGLHLVSSGTDHDVRDRLTEALVRHEAFDRPEVVAEVAAIAEPPDPEAVRRAEIEARVKAMGLPDVKLELLKRGLPDGGKPAQIRDGLVLCLLGEADA